MESGDEYGKHHHIGVMNKAHEEVLGHPQQATEWFPTQILPWVDPLMLCCRAGGVL